MIASIIMVSKGFPLIYIKGRKRWIWLSHGRFLLLQILAGPYGLKPLTIFTKKAPSYMFDWLLNTALAGIEKLMVEKKLKIH